MNLLPFNQTQSNQDLASFLATQGKEDYSFIDTNPLTCNAILLPQLAIEYAVDILGLDESQSRGLLSKAYIIHRHKGTPYAIESALEPLFEDIEIIEWFNDESLDKGCFNISLSLKDINYSKALVSKVMVLINKAKNVRSHLNKIDVDLGVVTTEDIKIMGGSKIDMRIEQNKYYCTANIEIGIGGSNTCLL